MTIISAAACFIMIGRCSSPQAEFTEKKIIIAAKETARINELDLSITNSGCGRKWIAEDGKAGSERPYCDLVIKYKGSAVTAGSDFKPVYIGNLEITLDKINPWGREEDSIPAGGCRVWVKRMPGR